MVALDHGSHRNARLPLVPAALLGVAAGAVVALALRVLPVPAAASPRAAATRTTVVVACVLLAVAAAEEAIWRWAVLDGLATLTGPLVAVTLSALGFAVAHGRTRRVIGTHTVTGGAFGLAYLATGRLAAAIGAHASYNLAVLAAGRGRRA